MKKLLLSIIVVCTAGLTNADAQCTVANQSISENFDSGTWPACWTPIGLASISTNKIQIRSYYQSAESTFVFAKTENAKGVITFIAQNTTNGQQGFGDVTVGAVSDPTNMASFVPIATVNIYPTISGNQIVYAPYTVDLSSYTGNYQYIVFTMPGGSSYSKTINIDNMVYESACISQSVNAVAQDLTVQLDATGNASITASQIDNGSSSDCDPPALSLDISSFSCDDVGPNTVVLTADDGQGNVETATATITVQEAIDDESVSATSSVVCESESTTITTGSSVLGIAYYLRDDADDTILDGPVTGTGSGLSFNTGAVNSTTTFNVEGKTQTLVSSGLDFTATNGYINFGQDNRGITTQVTVSLWMKSTISGEAQFILAKYNGVNGYVLYFDTNGKVHIDGRDGSGVYRQSGPSLTSVNDGQWHYITGTANVLTGIWTVFVDGVSEVAGANGTGTSLAAAYDMTLGQYTTYSMTVEVDQLNVWNAALDQTQVQATMNNCLVGSEVNLVGLYQFDEGSGTMVEDLSISGIDASMTGTVPWVTGATNPCILPQFGACDREMTELVTVSVTPSYSLTESSTVCQGESFIFPDGSSQTISSQTVYTSNLTTVIAGCDSTIETTVDINPTFDLTETESVCFDESFTFPDGSTQNNITSQVVYTSNLLTVATQCDSIIETTVDVTTVDASTTLNGNTITAVQTGADYQWVDCDNSNAPIIGAENQDFTPTASGNYAVEVTVNGCTEISGCTSMVLTGISESESVRLRVYPVPVQDILNMSYDGDIHSVSVYSADGNLVGVRSQKPKQIDVSDLSAGLYLLSVQTEKGISQVQFIKQ